MTIKQLEKTYNVRITRWKSQYNGGYHARVDKVTTIKKYIQSLGKEVTIPAYRHLFAFDGVSKAAFIRQSSKELEKQSI